MPVIKFDPHLSNLLIHDDKRFFLISSNNDLFLVTDNCPHRGGPLHLGQFDCQKKTVTCPWHEMSISLTLLQRSALPLVWRKDFAVVILPPTNSNSIVFQHSHILANSEVVLKKANLLATDCENETALES